MARISRFIHTNYWGKPAGEDSLEPQRSDLWFVDFATVMGAIQNVYGFEHAFIPTVLPHYVRSISLPECRVRPEMVRRCSVPYQTPSWDDPMDGFKMQFMIENDRLDVRESASIIFLNKWQQLVRAGRGYKVGITQAGLAGTGPDFSPEVPMLREIEGSPGKLVMPEFRFTFPLILLKGIVPTLPITREEIKRLAVLAASANRQARQAADSTKTKQSATPPPDADLSASASDRPPATDGEMSEATRVTVINAWLASYRISDLNYETSAMVTVEATFYTEGLKIGLFTTQ